MNAKLVTFALLVATLAIVPESASAYVGPGAGLSLLGALWALVAAVGVAVFFVIAWPVRRLLRGRSRNAGTGPMPFSGDEAEPLSKDRERG